MNRILSLLLLLAASTSAFTVYAADDDNSTRKERNYIREGNSLYKEKRYADAEVAYRKALEENAMSDIAMYNLAASLIRQSGTADPNSGNNPMAEAQQLLQGLTQSSRDMQIVENSFYNLGNMAFNQQQYDQAINMYKGALRKNPDNDKARENLRLAQLKRQEQQNQDQNQDKKDQDQNQDQQHNQQNHDKQQNKDQNQDKKDQDQQGDKEKNEKPKDQQPPQQQQGGISDANAAKILKTMENEENATRRKVQELKKKEEESSRRRTGNQW